MRLKVKADHPSIHFVSKGWGFEKWIVNKPEYCGKLLYFAKDRRCSLHYHKEKDEVFYVQSGRVKIYYCDDLERMQREIGTVHSSFQDICDSTILGPGDNFHVPVGRAHQIVADSYRIVKGD
jgi:mannose-6-phosphate isomerase-like protein (cupin superfamily)